MIAATGNGKEYQPSTSSSVQLTQACLHFQKRAVDKSIEEGLATWAQDSIKAGKLKDIVDSDIRGQISTKCLKGFVQIAGRCLLSHPKQRPTMAEVVFSLESALTLQEKINSSLQAGGRTIFGKMLDIFLFASNGENSAHDDSKLSSDVKDNVTGNLYPRGALGEGGSGKVSLGLVDNNTLITSNSDVGIKKYKEEGFQRHAANLTSLRENLYPSRPRPLPVVLPAATGQGLEISGQLVRKDGQIFYSLIFENNTNIPLDGFKIQFHKNTFGLAAGVPLQVPQVQPGTSARTLLPMVLFQNIALGPPKSILHVAVKNNQQPVWYFSDRLSLFVLFMEDGRMERSTFLETWKSLPDSNEVSKEIPGITINNVDATIEQLASSNMFFIAKHKNRNQELLYLSAKMTKGIPFLIELTVVIGVQGLKCAIKSPTPEIGPLFSEALETLLSCMG
ncbi:unnamed protein product [Lactuca virosa]|uniref:Beta-adaptin-like protein n=1 Tax=Lactuca virosa TaxID=75947 RepID=A0AAU9PH50_9ASTR|nr:unnamed protein product [Lactuca virosa]